MNKEKNAKNNIFKVFSGCIPFVIYLILRIVVFITQKATNTILRSKPQSILGSFGIIAFCLFLFWSTKIMINQETFKKLKSYIALKTILYIFVIGFDIFMLVTGITFSTLSYEPEHEVERNQIHMVGCVRSFLEETVWYYEYKNQLFRGNKVLGFEDYGNGGRDPLADGTYDPVSWYFYDLDGNVIEQSSDRMTKDKENKTSIRDRNTKNTEILEKDKV